MANALQQTFDRGRAQFTGLAPRERLMVVACAAVLLVTGLYLGVYEPVVDAHQGRVNALASARALATRLETASREVAAAGPKSNAGQAGRNMSLLAAVDQAAKSATLGKAPERLQPDGENSVKIWFNDVSFDAMVRWLAELQTRYGIREQTLDVEAQDTAGEVDARLSLTRP